MITEKHRSRSLFPVPAENLRGFFFFAVILVLFSTIVLPGCCRKTKPEGPVFNLGETGEGSEGRRSSLRVSGGARTSGGPKDASFYRGTVGRNIRPEKIQELNEEGLRAIKKSKYFRQAEALFNEGRYEEALSYYSSAQSELSGNQFIQRRKKNCELAISLKQARNDKIVAEINRAIVNERTAGLESLVEQLPRNDRNPFMRRNYHYFKAMVLEQKGLLDRASEEYVRYLQADQEIQKIREEAWTPPLEHTED